MGEAMPFFHDLLDRSNRVVTFTPPSCYVGMHLITRAPMLAGDNILKLSAWRYSSTGKWTTHKTGHITAKYVDENMHVLSDEGADLILADYAAAVLLGEVTDDTP
jgi:hypothetical protein